MRISGRLEPSSTILSIWRGKAGARPLQGGWGMAEIQDRSPGRADCPEPSGPGAVEATSDGLYRRPAPAGAYPEDEARHEASAQQAPLPRTVRSENVLGVDRGPENAEAAAAPCVPSLPSPGHDQLQGDHAAPRRSADAVRPAAPLNEEIESNAVPCPKVSLAKEIREAYAVFPVAGPPAKEVAGRRADARGTLVRLLVRYTLARNAEPREQRKAA